MKKKAKVVGSDLYLNWVIQSLKDEPGCLDDLWKEHREYMAIQIPKLHRASVERLQSELERAGLTLEVATLIAENMPCTYLMELDIHKKIPRNRSQREELEAIIERATKLLGTLASTSEWTLGHLKWEFLRPEGDGSPDPSMDPNWWRPLPDTPENNRRREAWVLLFGKGNPLPFEIEKTKPNPELIFALTELLRAAKQRKKKIPKDKGGKTSGLHDPNGARAREDIAVELRVLLEHLKQPCGCEDEGPVAKLLALVHEAATGETLADPGRFSEKVLKIREQRNAPNFKCEWPR